MQITLEDGKRDEFQNWLDRVRQHPTPLNPKAAARIYAKELAEGAYKGFWETTFVRDDTRRRLKIVSPMFMANFLAEYQEERWQKQEPRIEILEALQLVEKYATKNYKLSKAALELVDDLEPYSVFISYSRKQSSAFALLVHTWLNNEGYRAFIDKELNVGAQWEATLRKRIENCDYMVLILGEDSLPSENILNEIKWAVEFNVQIIPIWHHGYDFASARQHLPEVLFNAVNELHAPPIADENPLYYETAIRGLINRLSLGVTPDWGCSLYNTCIRRAERTS